MPEPRDPERDPQQEHASSAEPGAEPGTAGAAGSGPSSEQPRLPGSEQLKKVATRVQGAGAYGASFEAVLSIVIAIGIGYWAETRWGFAPWGVIVGAVLGFGAFVLRLVRLGAEINAENEESSDRD